jgi:large subunit ribosomal protein L10
MGRVEKEYMVDEINQRLKESSNLYISNFSQIGTERFNELREKLAENSAFFLVVKNRLCRLALKKAKLKELTDLVEGPTGFIICGDNPLPVSKILVNFSKGADGFSVRGGLIDGQLLNKEQIVEIASLPSQKEMLSMVAWAVKLPLVQFANIFRQLIKGLVISLSEISKQKTPKDKPTGQAEDTCLPAGRENRRQIPNV